MTTVFDVAAYILSKRSPLTTWKLQKLVYYSQAWSTVWDDEVLFPNRIEAWANGPVCPDLYDVHKGLFKVDAMPLGDAKALAKKQRETVDGVLEFYGKKTAQYLSELTHAERPWKEAREGLNPGERGSKEITPAALAEYYGGLSKKK